MKGMLRRLDWGTVTSRPHHLPPRRRKKWLEFWNWAAGAGIALLAVFIISLVGSFFILAKDLPRPDRLTERSSLSTKIYDRNNNLLYDIFSQQNRALVNLDQLPPYVKQATIAIEDKDFYRHRGFSQLGIMRAVFNILFRQKIQGGSTITQQVVKNTLLTPERTVTRKIKEFILAIQVEGKYSKDEILQIYLNEVPYGGTAWGIEAAAETYFGKKAAELTLTEAVVLAGLPQKPTSYSPFGSNPKAFIDRATNVARRMREDDYISKEQEKEIAAQLPGLNFAPQGTGIRAPHFVLYVRDLLVEQFGQKIVEQGGLQVTTSLDLELQQEAQKIVAEEIAKLDKLKVGNGAAIVTNPKTGEILTMVGSKDYFNLEQDGNVNVVLAKRQPGSAIKPVNYASAFKQGYTPAFLIMDTPTEFPGGGVQPPYRPGNYDGTFRGPVQVRFALGNSINMAAVKMLALGGIRNMLQTAHDMGLTTLEPTQENLERFGLSLTLGGGEVRLIDMAQAFGVFANSGERVDLNPILKVTDARNKTLFEFKNPQRKRVLSTEISFLISSILSDNAARSAVFGTNSLLRVPGKTVAVKTGTTDDKRDNWTGGYTTAEDNDQPRAVFVWVGNNDNSPMHPSLASGVTGAAPIWNRIARTALSKLPDKQFKQPSGVVQLEVDGFAGGLPCPNYPTRQEYFIKGTEPRQSCLVQKNFGGSDFFVLREQDPVSTDGRNRWQEGIDSWLVGQTDPRYHPPAELLAQSGSSSSTNQQIGADQVVVNMRDPAPEAQVSGVTTINAQVLSGATISKVELYVDGGFVISKSGSEGNNNIFSFTYDFSAAIPGKHRIEVRASNNNGKTGKSDVGVNVK